MNDKQEGRVGPGIQWTGRTTTNRIVNFDVKNDSVLGKIDYTGKLVDVKIEKAYAHSLSGRPVQPEPTLSVVKGDESHAA